MPLRPSETESGSRWLANFPPEERRQAQLLLDSLHIVSSSTFRTSLTQTLVNQIRRQDQPIAIFPIRKLPPEITRPTDIEEDTAPPLIPVEASYEQIPGSEGTVGNIIRDVIRSESAKVAISSPRSLVELRKAKVRTIMLVEDYSGTGTRVLKYLDAWLANQTVMSWYSYKLVRFQVVIGAVSSLALGRLRSHPHLEGIHWFQIARSFDTAGWTEGDRKQISKLCQRYAMSSKFELGFRKAQGLFVVQHTIPNTLPMILWQEWSTKIPAWQPFFHGRVFTPSAQAELMDYKLPVQMSEIANSLRQTRLGDTLSRQVNPTVQLHLLTLAASARGIRDEARLGLALDISTIMAKAHLDACRELGLLDNRGRLTEAGRAELRKGKLGPQRTESDLQGPTNTYYPMRLRGGDDF